MVQVGVQGAWGVIPIVGGLNTTIIPRLTFIIQYLNEIAPPAFRALFAGLSYQLVRGNSPILCGRTDGSLVQG